VQTVEGSALIEQDRLRSVQIFRLSATQLAPAEGDGPALDVANGEDQSVAEVIIESATPCALTLSRESCLDQLSGGVALLLEIAAQPVAIGRVTETPERNGIVIDTA